MVNMCTLFYLVIDTLIIMVVLTTTSKYQFIATYSLTMTIHYDGFGTKYTIGTDIYPALIYCGSSLSTRLMTDF